ncbi:FAD-dependent monooxygenase [Streptomyces sp. JJ36]|uniref:FAD-dependent monooxygenase n=1 Tax=Streptomyces sp. JJ36 TaxID=2736645 RepID=UPI001F0247EC|nr:FAD-dependent monooxygenase [Streptomyces sp. JJ36]MCF6522406.1 FAD-dependent monooxygenase [Streptomyces sp. JJ36]
MRKPVSDTGRAVVVGGGFAGVLAAAALACRVREVVVVERDVYPQGPGPRRGVPQARHVHLLWSGGARALEELVPGVTDDLLAAGARRVPLPRDMVALSPRGWFRRWPASHLLYLCSRDLLDWTIRRRVLADPRIRVREGTEVLGLAGDARRVTGVRLRAPSGEESLLTADLVVDAGGRGSRAPVWLAALGAGRPRERRVDTGLVYASRVYRAPAGTEDFPVVNVQADPRAGTPGRAAVVAPVEGGRWLVTVGGTRGGEPTADPEHFETFAAGARHGVVGALARNAEPLSPVVLCRSTVNRRRYVERLRGRPRGFVVLGDAVAAYNPVYGHGMSVAAQGALALRRAVRAGRAGAPGTARRAQRGIARPVSVAWDLATGQDVFYPGAADRPPSLWERLLARAVDRLLYVSTGSGLVARVVTDVMTLERPPAVLLRPDVVWALLRGPRLPQLSGPPLTAEEWAAAGVSGASAADSAGAGATRAAPPVPAPGGPAGTPGGTGARGAP